MILNPISRTVSFFLILTLFLTMIRGERIPRISGFPIFPVLGIYHCNNFPVEMLWRAATGTLSLKYGQDYSQYDHYLRDVLQEVDLVQFQFPEEYLNSYLYWHTLRDCLPKTLHYFRQEYAAMAIENFYRLIWSNSEVYSQLYSRARACTAHKFVYKPWSDIHSTIFRNFLTPMISYLNQNTIIALTSHLSPTNQTQILTLIQNKSASASFLMPVYNVEAFGKVFLIYYTIPGIPLLVSGKRLDNYYEIGNFSWAFYGILSRTDNQMLSLRRQNNFYELAQQIYDLVFTQEVREHIHLSVFRSLVFVNRTGIYQYTRFHYSRAPSFHRIKQEFIEYHLVSHQNKKFVILSPEQPNKNQNKYSYFSCAELVVSGHCICREFETSCSYFRSYNGYPKPEHCCIYELIQHRKQSRLKLIKWDLTKQLIFLCRIQLLT